MKHTLLTLALSLVFLPGLAGAAGAQSDDVSWAHPTERTDASPLPLAEIARTELEYVKGTGLPVLVTVTAPASVYTLVRTVPVEGTICWRARTWATDGQVSDWSGQVCKTVKGRPNPPGQVTVK